MVAHQAERQESKAELLTVVRQSPEILLPIFVIPEDGRTLVPPHDDVVNPSRKLQPRRPRHHKILQDFRTDPKQPPGLTPNKQGLANYKIILYRQESGGWVAEIPAIGGCYALMET